MAEKDRAFALKSETDALNENIGDLSDLETTTKSSTVEAINEAYSNLTIKTYTGTTGTTVFQGWYYSDTSVSSDISSYGTIVSYFVYSVANNHPGFAEQIGTSTIRVYTVTSGKAYSLKVIYAKKITSV